MLKISMFYNARQHNQFSYCFHCTETEGDSKAEHAGFLTAGFI